MNPLLIGAGVKADLSLYQLLKAESIKTKRPNYDIPVEMYSYLQKANEMANQTRLPGQDLMENNLRQTTQGALAKSQEVAGGSGNLLGAVADIYGNETKGVNQLNIAAANNYNANQRTLMGAEQAMAGYKDKQWKLNKLDPYMSDMATKSALLGAGIANMGGAVSEYTNSILAQKQNDKILELLGGWDKEKTGGLSLADLLNNQTSTTGGNDLNSLQIMGYGSRNVKPNWY